jgi:hypothetical protein
LNEGRIAQKRLSLGIVSKEYNWDHYDMAKKQANDDRRDNHVSYEDQMKMFFS